MAVSKKHYNVISVLLEAGVDTEMFTATGCCGTALHLAASFGWISFHKNKFNPVAF